MARYLKSSFADNPFDKEIIKKPKGYIDSKIIKEMLSKISLLETLIDMYGLIFEESGNRYRGNCPFPDHRDSDPSFDVYEDTGTYNCWGCGRHGDLLNFFIEIEGISFREALGRLSTLSGISLEGYDNEMFRILYDTNQLVNDHLNRWCESDLPGGVSDVKFLRAIAERLREHEEKVQHDPDEVEWVDRVYSIIDKYDTAENYKALSSMWYKLSIRLKERYKNYKENLNVTK